MNVEYNKQKTAEVLKWFKAVSRIPRCSKSEERIGRWLMDWAEENDFKSFQDRWGNVVIKVPASPGYENSPIVILQGHQDMVCEKTPDSHHNFQVDPILFIYEGEWLKADDTTLGADNGMSMAIGLTVALDKELKHPPLELVFTVDEETALSGAFGLSPDFFQGRRLLNIDYEQEGVFIVGSAGGVRSEHSIPLDCETAPDGFVPMTIKAGGMSGGHSADIHFEKANAIKIMARLLQVLVEKYDIRLVDLKGGTADNAIPRDCETLLLLPEFNITGANQAILDMKKILQSEYKNTDPDLDIFISFPRTRNQVESFTASCTRRVVLLLLALPHGIYAMSTDIEHFVETSNNLASLSIENKSLNIITSQRSSIETRLDAVCLHIASVVRLAGGVTRDKDRYPGWRANMESELLKKCREVYFKLFGKMPTVETTHGGLECGVINNKFPGIDMISFGPTLKDPHSPSERVHIPSISKIWDFIVALLETLK